MDVEAWQEWNPAMAHISSEILGLTNRFFKCMIKKLHYKITNRLPFITGVV